MKKVSVISLFILLSPAVLAEDSSKLISLNCRLCHSSSGLAIPKLNRLSAQQISQTLLDFKYRRRQSTVMGRLAKGFTDREIQTVAELIAIHGQ